MTDNHQSATLMRQAAQLLAAVCDGAVALDGHGFNSPDVYLGHKAAKTPPAGWDAQMQEQMWRRLPKYREQLAAAGFDWSQVPAPITRTVDYEPALKQFITRSPYSEGLNVIFRGVPGRRWDGQDKVNCIPDSLEARQALRRLLKAHGFVASAVAAPLLAGDELAPPPPPPPPKRLIEWSAERGGKFVITTPPERGLIEAIRSLPGRRWEAVDKVNTLPTTAAAARVLVDFARQFQVEVTAEAEQRIKDLLSPIVAKNVDDEAPLTISGLQANLRPYQWAGVKHMVRQKRTILADEMGTGKTLQTIATAAFLEAYPAVIVCPASLKLNWLREINRWLPGTEGWVVNGRNGAIPHNIPFIIINYDLLPYYVEKLRALNPKLVAFDESHYLKEYKSARSQAADDLVNGPDRDGNGRRARGQHKILFVFMLTGTPAMNRPKELIHPLSIMGKLDVFGGFWAFARKFCQAHQTRYGWDMNGAANLVELNQTLRGSGLFLRRTKKDVLKDLPPKTRVIIPVALPDKARRQYERYEVETAGWFGARAAADKEFLASLEGLERGERAAQIKARRDDAVERALRAEALTRIEALKQIAAKGKLEIIQEWAADFLETGEKLLGFASHRDIVDGLASPHKAPTITGDTPLADRQQIVDAFQSSPETPYLVMNTKAGGVGLTLTAASNVYFAELGWTPAEHLQAEDRTHRIGQAEAVTVYYFVAEGTIEEEIMALLENKLRVVEAITDGTETLADLLITIFGQVVKKLLSR